MNEMLNYKPTVLYMLKKMFINLWNKKGLMTPMKLEWPLAVVRITELGTSAVNGKKVDCTEVCAKEVRILPWL